jgi:hypothetical protein
MNDTAPEDTLQAAAALYTAPYILATRHFPAHMHPSAAAFVAVWSPHVLLNTHLCLHCENAKAEPEHPQPEQKGTVVHSPLAEGHSTSRNAPGSSRVPDGTLHPCGP